MATTEKVGIDKAILMLTELCTINQSRVTEINTRIDELADNSVKTTSTLEEIMTKLGNLEGRINTKEANHSNVQVVHEKDNDSLARPQLVFDHTHQPHCIADTSPVIKNVAATPLSSHAIIIPPSSSIPTFSGKHSERPKQFLVRIQEYAETVHGWNRSTLLLGISQFLRDTALDWYCQLKLSDRQPDTWPEFMQLFLSQFNSSIRSARQEQEWYECKQKEDETINEFIIRLRTLWTEQKPKETEVDLVKHLLCKMRNDILTMIGVARGATLDEIIMEAQKVEEILYRRKKEERRQKYLHQTSTQNGTSNINKSRYEVIDKQPQVSSTMNMRYPLNNRTAPYQRTTINKKNTDRSYPTTNYYQQTAGKREDMQYLESIKCYNCGMWGHTARNCPTGNSNNYQSNEKQSYSKNDERAVDSWDTNARQARYPPSGLILQLADNSQLRVQYVLSLPITIDGCTKTHTVYVVPRLTQLCIIGNDLIQKHDLQIDGRRQKAYFKQNFNNRLNYYQEKQHCDNDEEYILIANEHLKIPPARLAYIRVQPNKPFLILNKKDENYEIASLKNTSCVTNGVINPRKNLKVEIANLTERVIRIRPGQPLAYMKRLNHIQVNLIYQTDLSDNTSKQSVRTSEPNLAETDLNQIEKQKLLDLIQTFPDVFSEKTGKTSKVKHEIKLLPGSQPCNLPPYRIAPARRQIVEQNLREMLQDNVIVPSKSPWASPVVLAPKKDGTLRFCVDYRKLNAMTVRDAYPIPRIDDTLDSLQEAKFISTLDLRTGYWQVEMDERSREKTAFITQKGLFEFKVMPYGLTNAPATFQRLMDIVLAGLKWQCCLVYIDDVIIYSSSFEQHIEDLKRVFDALRSANLTLKTSKCHFCRRETKYLGHIITSDGIKPDPELIKSVVDFPRPQTIKDVQSFLGLTGYYRRFIKNYAKIAEPLIEQLRYTTTGNHHLQWSEECTKAFNIMKAKLTTAPIMNTPNFEQPFILEVDACEYGLGAVLTQEYADKKYVIAYASRTLSAIERKYGATEREALAIVWATKHFRVYIEGSTVLIRSDCKALEWLRNAKDITGRLARWAMKLSAYQIENIQYRPGKQNANADSLSRNPVSDSVDQNPKLFAIETAINLWENTNILDEIKTEQQADSKLKHIMDKLRSNHMPIFNDNRNSYLLINDILYKVKNSNRHYNQREIGNKHLLVIPKSMQLKLLSWAHDHPSAGHGGQQKTLFRLTTRVFWDSIRKDVYDYVASCQACQRFKYNNIPLANPLQIHTVNEPWHTIGIDLMGPFPKTARQKRFLLVIVDYFTRWVEVFPLRTTTSVDIAQILINEIFTRYGMPIFILSDNGPQFVSLLFDQLCKTLGIQQKFTANYHPQTNLTERVNRTLKPMLAIFAHEHPHSWDKEVQKLALSIRTSINETTGETPAFMMFGRDLKLPMDLIIGEPTQGLPPTSTDSIQINEYRKNLIHNLRSTYNFVREHSEVEKIMQKTKYDQHTSQREFNVGDLVWIATNTPQIGEVRLSKKFQPNYQGPCRLMEQLGPSTFLVRRISDGVNLGATNINRIKKYFEPIPDNQSTLISDDIQHRNAELSDESNMEDEISQTSNQNLDSEEDDSTMDDTQMIIAQPNSKRKLIDESDSSTTETQVTTDQPKLRIPSTRKRQRPARYRDSSF
ncbi:unnamed protein product [Adineta steineri]|uniref:RNA-directed DNA polymerase n=1 Tax=Adineta steineri TaxID=433720 RepID=A0A819TRW7_9BILA|nr:unnamed protein product [Adineta steineri]